MSNLAPQPDSFAALVSLNAIDRHFATLMARLGGDSPELVLAAAMVSYHRSLGHVCLDLQNPGEVPNTGPFPEASRWARTLRQTKVVGAPGEFKPLILDEQNRLYLRRYWEYENQLAAFIQQRSKENAIIDAPLLKEGLARLFHGGQRSVVARESTERFPPGTEVDWQRAAAFAALKKKLCIISGGPGTGKTRTVVMLLALLIEQTPGQLRIALAAPTGKAAARLQQSIRAAKSTLACSDEIKSQLPEETSTLHRLLGSVPGSAYFKHNADNPLPFDVIVVDEASMVDLALMAKLVSAVRPASRLILLGDKDQLASVEAGAVLADICNAGAKRTFSQQFAAECAAIAGVTISPVANPQSAGSLSDCIIELRKNYRFGNDSGIYRLSVAVNEGEASQAATLLRQSASRENSDVFWNPLPKPARLKHELKEKILNLLAGYLQCDNPAAALEHLNKFRILCALRAGPYGVERLNELIEQVLREAGLIDPASAFYRGRPVMITRNDYNLRLFNGDIGVLLPNQSGELRAFFAAADGALRDFSPLRLPQHETVYAMTVHKSQGSEFERVLFIVPDEDSPILTRELIYTGLTRASRQVEIWADQALFQTAVTRKIFRRSGLRDALWGIR